MAYVNQEKKAKIAAALKLVVPANWKYTLRVRNHSTIVMTIRSAPIDLHAACGDWINVYHYDRHIDDECIVDTIAAIVGALNTDNHDRSDIQSDYFDVGHYVDLRIGEWNKPFVLTGPLAKFATA